MIFENVKKEKKPYQILIVDDVIENLKLLSEILNKEGYKVRVSPSGKLALRSVQIELPDLILLDVRMPKMDGYEVCRNLKADMKTESIPIIFISANDDIDSKIKAFEEGGVDYITKPIQENETLARISTHLKLKDMSDKIKVYNNQLETLVISKTKEIEELQYTVIHAFTKLAEYRDDDTGEHIERTRFLCKMISEKLMELSIYDNEIDKEFINSIFQAAPLHDIGKVGIPDSILLKKGKLTDEEFDEIKNHSKIGASALRQIDKEHPGNDFIKMGIELTQSHHEKWDGTGYPDGLAGENIPLSARIMAIADVYDALTSVRPYKKAYSHEKSCVIIEEGKGVQFDPQIVNAFMEIESEIKLIRLKIDNEGESIY
ncbi:response regulator [Clostridiaceae bacterium HSG29]|nr:response regulator [Clostridiaceae bacterium HSG29]